MTKSACIDRDRDGKCDLTEDDEVSCLDKDEFMKPETAVEETDHESSPKSTRPEWFKWLTWPFIGLFIFFWIDGFFGFNLIPEDWKGWMFGVIFAGFVIITVLGIFGKGGSGGTPTEGGGDFGGGDVGGDE